MADNGPGLSEGFDLERHAGTGLRLVEFIAQKQLQGTLELRRRGGEFVASLTFPWPRPAGTHGVPFPGPRQHAEQ